MNPRPLPLLATLLVATAATARGQSLSCDPPVIDVACGFAAPLVVRLDVPAPGALVTASGFDGSCLSVSPNPAMVTGTAPSLARFTVRGAFGNCPCSSAVAFDSPGFQGCSVTIQTSRTSSAIPFGAGCPGASGRAPFVVAQGVPSLGNGFFAVEVHDTEPFAAAALLLSLSPAFLPIDQCTLLLASPYISLRPVTADSSGIATTPFSIQNDPFLFGTALFGQYIAVDSRGSLYGFATLSDGLRMVIAL